MGGCETVSLPLQGGGSVHPPSHPNFPRPTVGPRGSAYRQMRDSTPEMEAEEGVLTTRRGSRGGDQPGLIAPRHSAPCGQAWGKEGGTWPHPPRMCLSPAAVWIPHGRSGAKATRELLATSAHGFLVPASGFPSPTPKCSPPPDRPHPNPRCHLPLVDESPLIQHSVTHTVEKEPGPQGPPPPSPQQARKSCGMKKKDQTGRQEI